MRFKAFLNEEKFNHKDEYMQNGLYRAKSINRETAISMVREHCKKAISFERPLMFRGTDKETDNKEESYLFAVPTIAKRTSANSDNHYTVLFDNFKSWSEFPKRSESLVGITAGGFWIAASYSSPFIVLPYDNAKIGICPTADLWTTFKSAYLKLEIGDLGDLSYLISDLISESKYPGTLPKKNQDFKLLKDCLDYLTDWLRKNDNTGQQAFQKSFDEVITGKYTMYEYFEKLLSPKEAKIILGDYEKLNNYVAYEREVWTDSNSILIAASENHATNKKVFLQFYTDFRNEVLKNEV